MNRSVGDVSSAHRCTTDLELCELGRDLFRGRIVGALELCECLLEIEGHGGRGGGGSGRCVRCE